MPTIQSALRQFLAAQPETTRHVRMAFIPVEAKVLRKISTTGKSLSTCGRGCVVQADQKCQHGSVTFAVKYGLV